MLHQAVYLQASLRLLKYQKKKLKLNKYFEITASTFSQCLGNSFTNRQVMVVM